MVANPSGTRTPAAASSPMSSPSEAFLPPTTARSLLRAAASGTICANFFIGAILTRNAAARAPVETPRAERYNKGLCGGIAQLVERLHGMQEVSGSNPLISTLVPIV